MQKEEYDYRQQDELLRRKKPRFSFEQHPKTELHHPLGKGNSSVVTPLCTGCHVYLTADLNHLSRSERQDLLLKAIASIKGLHDLENEMIGAVMNKVRQHHEIISTKLPKQKRPATKESSS